MILRVQGIDTAVAGAQRPSNPIIIHFFDGIFVPFVLLFY